MDEITDSIAADQINDHMNEQLAPPVRQYTEGEKLAHIDNDFNDPIEVATMRRNFASIFDMLLEKRRNLNNKYMYNLLLDSTLTLSVTTMMNLLKVLAYKHQ